jgi:subtilisin family serine protease
MNTSRISFIFIILFTLSVIYSTPIYSQDYSYKDKLFGTDFSFEPHPELVSVKYLSNLDSVNTASKQELLALGFNVKEDLMDKVGYLLLESSNPDIATFSTLRNHLRNETKPKISALPVFVNDSGQNVYMVPNEVTVQFKENIEQEEAIKIIQEWGSNVIREQRTKGYFTIATIPEKDVFSSVREIMQDNRVKFTEPSTIGFDNTLNDPYLADSWHIKNTGQQNNYTDGSDLNISPSWEIASGNSSVIIAVLDDGFDLQHPDLSPNILARNGEDWNFASSSSSSPQYSSGQFHGTAVSGIATSAKNSVGSRGVSYNSKLMPIKINLSSGMNQNRADAINYVVSISNNYDAIVISNSWFATGNLTAIRNAVINAENNGIPTVFAAGNFDGNTVLEPAKFTETIAVGAMAPCDNKRKSPSTCDGENWGSNYGENLDVAAPGVKIYTTDVQGSSGYNQTGSGDLSNTDYTKKFNGTSSSTPMVSGTIANMLSVNPNLTIQEIRTIISNTAEKVGGYNYNWNSSKPGHSKELGYGRLNALKAVYQAQRLAVQDQMVNFKSLDGEASGTNSSRRSVYQSSSSTYHVVFQSGSEIVYFKRPPWGSPSQPILISENQTFDFGKNQNPNITIDTNGNLHAVWERKAYGSDQWQVYYSKSTNDGSTWSTPAIVSPVGSEPMNPQIVAYDAYYDNEMMLTYYYFHRIRAKMYNFSSGTWKNWAAWSNNGIYSPGVDAIPGTDSDTREFSTIASDRYGSTKMNIVYVDENNDHLYYRKLDYFSDWGQYTNLSSIVPGTAKHHSPSISNDPSYTTGASPAIHLAWTRTTGSGTGPYDNKVIHRWTSSQSSWPSVYYTTYYQLQAKPSISGVGSTGNYDAYLTWEIQGNAGIARQYFNGSGWTAPVTVTTNGKYPSLSTGGNQTKYFYTDENGPIYDVTLSSQTLSKVVGEDPNFNPSDFEYQRSISFMDSSGAFIEFIVHNLNEENDNSYFRALNLKDFHQDSVDLSLSNALNVFQVTETDIRAENTITFKLKIRGNRIENLFNDGNIPEVLIGGKKMFDNESERINTLSSLSESSDFEAYSVKLHPLDVKHDQGLLSLNSDDFKKGVFASLGHNLVESSNASIHEKSINLSGDDIEGFDLSAYPNPFNPSTNISFTLPEQAFVKLRVFDILGREVATLANEVLGTGKHIIPFNASSLASGLYIYQLESGTNVISKKLTIIK